MRSAVSRNVTWAPGMTLSEMERQVVKSAYAYFDEDKTRTANALGISVKTVYSYLERYAEEDLVTEQRKEDEKRDKQNWLERSRRGHAAVDGNDSFSSQGHDLQSSTNTAQKRQVSVSERSKVQDVLPTKDSTHRHGRGSDKPQRANG